MTSKNPDQTKIKSLPVEEKLRKQKVTRKTNCMCSIKGHAFSRWILSPGPDWKTLVTTSTYFENGSFQLTHLKKECCWTNLPSFSNSNLLFLWFEILFLEEQPPTNPYHQKHPNANFSWKLDKRGFALLSLCESLNHYYCGFGKQNWKQTKLLAGHKQKVQEAKFAP